MPRLDIVNECAVERTARVVQLEGLFDLPPAELSRVELHPDLPIEDRPWQIGLVVGPSGCGKSTIARKLWPDSVVSYDWPENRSVVDAFGSLPILQITSALSSVGFSSPPAWLRPFHVLSTGQQFRADLARALCNDRSPIVVDEFTSVVDRQVAQVGSAAIAKVVRRMGRTFVAVSCHYDIIPWLCPDWIYEPHTESFSWGSLRQRPPIALDIRRAERGEWKLFKPHHYLSADLNPTARCFVAQIAGAPVAFVAVMSFPHATRPGFREHRVVCLPDYQGVGIGNALSEYVASMYACRNKPYRSTTSNPAMIAHRRHSPLWRVIRRKSLTQRQTSRSTISSYTTASNRFTESFQWCGGFRPDDARAFGLLEAKVLDSHAVAG